MKKIISIVLLGATTSLMAMYAEQATLYKDPRIMAKGGANVAVGAYSTSVFSNPAGIASIKKDDGFVIDILSIGVSATSDIETFITDLSDASDEDDDSQMIKVLEAYSGQHFHIGLDNYSALSKHSDMFAWSIGVLEGVDVNLMPHANGTDSADLLETTSRAYGGVVLAVAKPFATQYGRVDVGLGVKYITQQSYEGTLGINDIVGDDDEDIADVLQEKYEKKSSAIGIDIGAVYKPFVDQYWNATFGLSILNIGSLDMDDNYGSQPMTVNIGVSATPEVEYIHSLVLALDYVDVFNANKLRMYNYQQVDGSGKFTDYSTGDFMKNIRLGAAIGLVHYQYFNATLNLGLYQSSYTAGFEMEIMVLKLNFATYEEQVGNATTAINDRRYMGQIGFYW